MDTLGVLKRAASFVVDGLTVQRMIVEITTAKGSLCRDILVGLPDWFGLPESIEDYAHVVERMTMFAIRRSEPARRALLLVRPAATRRIGAAGRIAPIQPAHFFVLHPVNPAALARHSISC